MQLLHIIFKLNTINPHIDNVIVHVLSDLVVSSGYSVQKLFKKDLVHMHHWTNFFVKVCKILYYRVLAARGATRREPLGRSEWGRSSTDANFANSALKVYSQKKKKNM